MEDNKIQQNDNPTNEDTNLALQMVEHFRDYIKKLMKSEDDIDLVYLALSIAATISIIRAKNSRKK